MLMLFPLHKFSWTPYSYCWRKGCSQ